MCKVFKVSRSAYFSFIRRVKKSKLILKDKEVLKRQIREVYESSMGRYGSLKVYHQLKKMGIYYSHSWITKLMNEMGLKSIVTRKYAVTTDSKHDLEVANNIVDRNFKVNELGKVWVSDITYVRVGEKWNYITSIIDLADRQIVGYAVSTTMTTEDTVLKAWSQARAQRLIQPGFIFHSDRGSQYASKDFSQVIKQNLRAVQSMSRKGNCWDNAVAESFFKSLKYECLYHHNFKTTTELKQAVFKYIHWYNYARIHSAIDFMTPVEKELEILSNNSNCA